jgi:hypothetical protein
MADTGGSIRKQKEKIKEQMRADIIGTQSVADQLTGKQAIGGKKLQAKNTSTDKKKAIPEKIDAKKLEKFFDLMENYYKSSNNKVEITRKI